MLTVENILSFEVLKEAKQMAGGNGNLDKPVEWVSIIETPVEDFVRKNEVVLTTGIGCRNDEKKLLSFVKEVMDSDAAALIMAVGRYVREIPKGVLAYAETHGFPIIEIPWEVRFAEISQAISQALHRQEHEGVKMSEEFRKQLLEIILEGKGLNEICTYVHKHLKAPVLILDKRGVIKGRSKNGHELEEIWQNYLYHTVDPLSMFHEDTPESFSQPNMHWLDIEQESVLQILIQSAREIQGFLLISLPEPQESVFNDHTLPLLEHAVTASALCFLHDHAVLETEMRLRDDFVWSLAKGQVSSWDAALSRAKSLGYSLNVPYLCLLARPENLRVLYDHNPQPHASYEQWLHHLGSMFEEEVFHAGRTMQLKTMCTFQREELVVFVEVRSERNMETIFPFLDLLQYRLEQKLPQLTVSWGVAKTSGKQSFYDSFQEARTALDIGRRQRGKGYISTYADTRFDRALMALAENNELKQITDATIAPIVHYSKERGIDLIHTFVVYNQHKGNVSQTARALNLHRQSLLYRLKKIENMTGCDLDNPEDMFLIDLSIRLHTLGYDGDKEGVLERGNG